MYTTYQEWIDGIKDWLDADHLTDDQIGTFLTIAQARLNRELNAWEMEATTSSLSVAGAISLPAAFNRIRQVSVAGTGTFEASTKGEIANLGAVSDVSRRLFAIDAGSIIIYPNIGDGVTVVVDYYVKVTPINSSLDTNLFTTSFSDLMLWAALVEGSNFIVEDDRAQLYEAKYQQALEAINQQPKKVKFGSTPLRRLVRTV